ncbi:MAG: SCP2 sterol-binding domain-containing protein [Candidatus Binatia bacterium]|nr:SCP2 sterol-binding domain-containing protein [Candidatus Binatia bacterium]
MAKHAFLSDGWLDTLIALNEEYADKVPAPAVKMRLNQNVSGVPFGDGAVQMHTDTTQGNPIVGRGHLENPEVTITTDYETARALVVMGDQAAAMQAFMSGKIKVDGDMTKIMVPPPPKNDAQIELDQKIKDMTE